MPKQQATTTNLGAVDPEPDTGDHIDAAANAVDALHLAHTQLAALYEQRYHTWQRDLSTGQLLIRTQKLDSATAWCAAVGEICDALLPDAPHPKAAAMSEALEEVLFQIDARSERGCARPVQPVAASEATIMMQSQRLRETGRTQVEETIAATVWGGHAAADRITVWASIHAHDMNGTNNIELRLLDGEHFFALAVTNETLQCTYSPLDTRSNARGVPMPSELSGIWLTLVGLSLDSLAFHDRATCAAHVRLTAAARQLFDTTYPEPAVAFARLRD